jgi:glucokinase
MESRIVLAADVGGTNTKLAIGRCGATGYTILHRTVYPSRGYPTFHQAVEAFLGEAEVRPFAHALGAACFAVAGPVENGSAGLTNLSWRIDESEVAAYFGIPRVCVINDFAAAGLGIAELAPSDFLALQAGVPVPEADRVVIGAGTGLGVAWMTWDSDGDRYCVHPSEGGHGDFAPGDELQDELLRYLRRELGHVSCERVLSGPALPRILAFLHATNRGTPSRALLDAMAGQNPSRAITQFGLAGTDDLAVRALDLFVSAYGSFAGNMALLALSHGGLYVAGGIAPKIAAKLQDGTFVRAFNAKGRFVKLLETIPVKVVLNEQVGLLGAVAEAVRIARA